jgi:hypothetical protein
MNESDQPSHELDAALRWGSVPEALKRARRISTAQNERVNTVLKPRIDDHLRVYQQALDVLDDAHRSIADRTNLDLESNTRQAAVWVVSGRCIGQSCALITLLRAGFGAETSVQTRAMHEATRLAAALADESESDLLRRWLADDDKKWVRPKETRAAQERIHSRFRRSLKDATKAAQAAGDAERTALITSTLDSMPLADGETIGTAAAKVYDVLSRASHARRSGMKDALSPVLRVMVTGSHPDPAIRASYVDYGGRVIEEVLLTIGEIVSRFYAQGWYMTTVAPLIRSLHDIRQSVPIDAAAISGLGS